MANYAALIDVLSVAGSRLSDGSPNASGTVYFFRPGTNTPVNAYSDAAATTIITQPVVLTSGGLLNTSTFPGGIFVTQPVRMLVQDVSGNTVVDTTYIPATAGDVGISNSATTATTLDQWITQAQTSTGGTDFNYLVANGQTPRPIGATITEICVSVKSFGAKGDGIAIDTTAIQNAINFVIAAGGGVCYFPPGTYVIDQALSLSAATGVRLVGSGSRASIIATTHASANTLLISTCTACTVENIRVDPSGANSAAGIQIADSIDTGLHRVTFKENHDIGVLVTGTSNVFISESSLVGVTADISFTGSNTPSFISASSFAGATLGLDLSSTAQNITVVGCRFRPTTGVKFEASLTGTNFVFMGNPTLGECTTPLNIATATLPVYRQWGNKIDAVAFSAAIGNTLTPVLYKGKEILLSATSGGAGTQTVAVPAILPGTSTSDVDLFWDFVFKNAAGGAVTWSLNAVFVVASAIPTTDAHTIGVRFRWDRATSKLREVSRADTVT